MLLHVAVVFLFHCLKRVPVTPKKSPQTSVTSMAQHLFSWQICSLAMLVPASFGFKQGCLKAGPSIVWSFAYMSGGWWQNTFMWPEHAHYMVAGLQGQASHLHVVRRGGVESTWARQTLLLLRTWPGSFCNITSTEVCFVRQSWACLGLKRWEMDSVSH